MTPHSTPKSFFQLGPKSAENFAQNILLLLLSFTIPASTCLKSVEDFWFDSEEDGNLDLLHIIKLWVMFWEIEISLLLLMFLLLPRKSRVEIKIQALSLIL